MEFLNTSEFAGSLDQADDLRSFRELFLFPQHNDEPVVYFTGNSLGLQPKSVKDHLVQELDDWAKLGVEGHFKAKHPWYSYHEQLTKNAAALVGGKENEVVMMNQLTVNLHLLMVTFYRPEGKRKKIICEAKAFPSDQYALESQVRYHGFDPDEAVIEISPRSGEYHIREDDIIKAIQDAGEELSLVMIGGVNYFTGQVFDMKKISAEAHKVGAYAGFDLAHAAGNIELSLHEWNVDFAAWCTYKYLNSGPGSVGGVFIHERHAQNKSLPRFAGWWGHDKAVRFKMEKGFIPIDTAEGWQLSNAPVLSMAAHKASLEVFAKAGMKALNKKSKVLTSYLEFIINELNKDIKDDRKLEVITPAARGCQLSVVAHGRGKELFTSLLNNGVICDWREPNVIRMAPVPLYNSFSDIYRFGQVMKKLL